MGGGKGCEEREKWRKCVWVWSRSRDRCGDVSQQSMSHKLMKILVSVWGDDM